MIAEEEIKIPYKECRLTHKQPKHNGNYYKVRMINQNNILDTCIVHILTRKEQKCLLDLYERDRFVSTVRHYYREEKYWTHELVVIDAYVVQKLELKRFQRSRPSKAT